MPKWIVPNLIAIVAMVAIAIGGYFNSSILLPKSDVVINPPDCDLNRQACPATLPDGRTLELSLLPRPVPTIQTLAVTVTLPGNRPHKLEADFEGVDMSMGLNRITLQESAPGVFRGETSLPVCITTTMDWRVSILAETTSQRISVVFPLRTSL
jgi:hypothetical protein